MMKNDFSKLWCCIFLSAIVYQKKSKTLKKKTLYMIISGNVIKDYNINNVRQVLKGNAM